MAFVPPLARAAARAEAPAAVPARALTAAPTVVVTRADGSAGALPAVAATAHRAAARVSPRRARRGCIRLRASASRLETVPSFQPSRVAGSGLSLPLRAPRAAGTRLLLGRPPPPRAQPRLYLSPGRFEVGLRVPPARRPPLAGLPPGRRPPRVAGRAPGHAVQPAGQRRVPADRGGVAGQHEEGGLEGVLRVLVVAQHAAADAHDQGAVAPHQRGESGLVAGGAEALQ